MQLSEALSAAENPEAPIDQRVFTAAIDLLQETALV
jgi:hypothetical protein